LAIENQDLFKNERKTIGDQNFLPKVIDLSQEIFQGMPVWPGHHKTIIWTHATHEETRAQLGDMSWEARVLLMSEHAGTHADALYEIDPNGPTIDKMKLEWFYGPAVCLDLSQVAPRSFVSVKDLEQSLKGGIQIRRKDIVLLYTGHYNRTYGAPEYLTDYPGLDEESTEWFAKKGVVNIGIDAPSIDCADDPKLSAHRAIRRLGTLTATEHLANLDKVVNMRFTYFGVPIKIRDGSGAPIRALAMLD
jgi:kynurenine formamidase